LSLGKEAPNQRPSKFLGESLRLSDAAFAPALGNRQDPRPIRADARARLIAALSCGRRWLDEMLNGSVKSIEEIANRDDCGTCKVNMALTLGPPEIVRAAIDGRLPRGVGISRLTDPLASWREQFRQLGIATPAAAD
jgi:site-specific DNA recombinase